jgi:hypothetical protein
MHGRQPRLLERTKVYSAAWSRYGYLISPGGWPIFALHHSHGGCPILAFFARACPELVEGVGGDAAGATLVRSAPPVVYAVVVPALRKVREGRAPAAVVASAV